MNNFFPFGTKVTAFADERMNNQTVKNLWKSFCFGLSELTVISSDKLSFVIGSAKPPICPEDKEYSIFADENGVAVTGRDYGGLMRGFITLLMKLKYTSLKKDCESFFLPYIKEESQYTIKNRMIHICVFPENDLYFIKKLIRLAGILQYTHIVIEFWGMLKYECLEELAWQHAFTKDDARELIREVRELGMEPVPMFNMFGHATASRVIFGKHVVLDRNPSLQYLFTPDGWAWDITSPDVYELLKNIRLELYEIFGETEYFHIGCDEAYYYMQCDELRRHLPDYLSRLTGDIIKEGRRPMLWMDMILEQNKFPSGYYAFGKEGEADGLLKSLAKGSVMVDWQYEIKTAPVESAVYLKEKAPDYDLIIAPWFNAQNYNACIETIKEHNMSGIMLTTWHTLKDHMTSLLGCAKKCGAETFSWSSMSGASEETATLLRRVSFEGNSYEDSGWSKKQIVI